MKETKKQQLKKAAERVKISASLFWAFGVILVYLGYTDQDKLFLVLGIICVTLGAWYNGKFSN